MNNGVILLARHAETSLNAENKFRGTANPVLTAKGRAEARSMKAKLDGQFDRVVTDAYLRTRQTAAIIAPGHSLEIDDNVGPWDVGELSGTSKKGMESIFEKVYVEHPEIAIPEGESLNSFLRRWKMTYERYLDMAAQGQRILIVSHGSNLGAVLFSFRPVALEDGIVPPNGSIVKVLPGQSPQLLAGNQQQL
jgi:broad specificity phosphatase PhoE